MLEKDAILSKISIVKNCLRTIRKVTKEDPKALSDVVVQDVFVLNLQRAIQAAIDMANLIISEKSLQLPASYKDSFVILLKEGILKEETAERMQKMVGFRNIAIHDYQKLDLKILKAILSKHLKDLESFCVEIHQILKAKK